MDQNDATRDVRGWVIFAVGIASGVLSHTVFGLWDVYGILIGIAVIIAGFMFFTPNPVVSMPATTSQQPISVNSKQIVMSQQTKAALSSDDTRISEAAISKIVKIGKPTIPSLVQLLSSDDDNLASNAARALGEMGEVGMNALIASLPSDNPRVRMSSVIGLAWADEPPVQYFAAYISDRDEYVRITTAAVLARQGEIGLSHLTRAINDPDAEIRFAATNGLMLMMDDLSSKIHDGDEEQTYYASLVLNSAYWTMMKSRLIEHESDSDFRVRTNASVLGQRAFLTEARLRVRPS